MAKNFKTRNPEKYDYAQLLYMNGSTQKEVAQKVGTTESTVSGWVRSGGWEAKRAARNISPEQIANKLLVKLNGMLEAGEDFNPAVFAKITRQLKSFKREAGIDDLIYVFIGFGSWLERVSLTDDSITPELIGKITSLQDKFILCRRSEEDK